MPDGRGTGDSGEDRADREVRIHFVVSSDRMGLSAHRLI
jgi:hypothetical protein